MRLTRAIVTRIGWLASQAEGGLEVGGGTEGECVVAREAEGRQDGRQEVRESML